MDIRDLIRDMHDEHEGEKLTRADNIKLMKTFLDLKEAGNKIQKGDVVVRNLIGKNKYRGPKKNQIAVCIERFPEVKPDGKGDVIDMVIALTMGKDEVATFPVHSAYYSKADEKKNVVDLFN